MPVCHGIQPVLFPGSASPSHWSPQEARTAPASLTAMIWCPAQAWYTVCLLDARPCFSIPESLCPSLLQPLPSPLLHLDSLRSFYGGIRVTFVSLRSAQATAQCPPDKARFLSLVSELAPAHVQPQPRCASGLCLAFVFSVCYLPNLATWQSAPLPQRPKRDITSLDASAKQAPPLSGLGSVLPTSVLLSL